MILSETTTLSYCSRNFSKDNFASTYNIDFPLEEINLLHFNFITIKVWG